MDENSTLFYHVHCFGDQGSVRIDNLSSPMSIPEEIESLFRLSENDVNQNVINNILQEARKIMVLR